MELKITLGEWRVEYDNEGNGGFSEWFNAGPSRVAFTGPHRKEAEANALAISRVPRMLDFIAAFNHDESGYMCPERFKCEQCNEARALLEGLVEE